MAKAAEVGVATVYRKFATKDDLIHDVYEPRFAAAEQQALDAAQDPDPWAGYRRVSREVGHDARPGSGVPRIAQRVLQLRRARRAGEPTQFRDRCCWTQGLLHILDLPNPRRVSTVQIHATVASLRKHLKDSIDTAVAGRASGSAGTAATTSAITRLICTWGGSTISLALGRPFRSWYRRSFHLTATCADSSTSFSPRPDGQTS
ncbi:TetR/AcrR family transcriptional regulator [Amycolatopsis alba]|uniref:TetR/AcrR family transcriptional regulator n=1 Tax=Amycolatopsis alba TaxID=76020 RepID=UPI001FD848AF|nr:TetR/AcrR family transcriptional regulator [Amycolatopsis alba]